MELHAVEMERKLRLPDPTKAMEGVWKLLKRTRQQLNMTGDNAVGVSGSSSEAVVAKRLAKIEAERQKGRGAQYVLRNTFR